MNGMDEAAVREAIRSVLSEVVPQIRSEAKAANPVSTTAAPDQTGTQSPPRSGSFGPPASNASHGTTSALLPLKPRSAAASSPPGRGNVGAFSAGSRLSAEPAAPQLPEQPHPTGAGAEVIGVSIENDRDLLALVFDVLRHAENPRRRDDIRAGRLSFKLTSTQRRSVAPTSSVLTPVRVDKGALTERTVQAAAGTGTSFILGRGASVTPLAAESARRLGITIEREK